MRERDGGKEREEGRRCEATERGMVCQEEEKNRQHRVLGLSQSEKRKEKRKYAASTGNADRRDHPEQGGGTGRKREKKDKR